MFLSAIPILSQDSLVNKALALEAAKGGIFYFKIPKECQEYIRDAVKFSYQFPNDEKIKQYTDGKFGGYHDREHDQIESFYVERKDWNTILPTSLQPLALKMANLTNVILKAILQSSGIPEELWDEGTGLITEGKGLNHISFNHYRCEKNVMGFKAHQDIGFVSVLFVEKSGLQAYYKEKWEEVPPLTNHFVVILGKAFEILVNDVSKVSAAWHRVHQLYEARISFAMTCDHHESQAVKKFQKETHQLETVHASPKDYMAECFKQIYSS